MVRKSLDRSPKRDYYLGAVKKFQPLKKDMQTIAQKEFLKNYGFSIYEVLYLGCPKHPSEDGWGCPINNEGHCDCKSTSNKSYWKTDNLPLMEFRRKLKETSEYITYVFSEDDGTGRKIGEGQIKRINKNLNAHYNHGISKVKQTSCDRKDLNEIAKRCRKSKTCLLFVKPVESKDDARRAKKEIKQKYRGWLDWDQK